MQEQDETPGYRLYGWTEECCMPIYEFYCPDCHVIYQFLSKTVGVKQVPACPKCRGTRLTREVSRFALIGKAREEDGEEDFPFDETRMMEAMEALAGEAESISEDDPKAAAALMRKFAEKSGMPLGDAMEEAIQRMEAGEDPDAVEAEMGDALEDDAALFGSGKSGKVRQTLRRMREPLRDGELYEMDSA